MKPKVIYIEWIDHSTYPGWVPMESTRLVPYQCVSVGILIRETKDALTISTTLSEDEKCDTPLTILKACIKKRKFIKPNPMPETVLAYTDI